MSVCLNDYYAGRRCLVTGCGFVGSHLVDALLAAGAVVRVASQRGRTHRIHARLDSVVADLTRPEECRRAAEGWDYVFHAAGGVGAAGVGPADAMANIALNLTLTANMVQAAWHCGCARLLLFGSSTAYPAADHPMAEEDLWAGPVFPGYHGYGWMRRYVERMGEYAASRSATRVTVVRPGALYGPRDNFDPQTSHVIAGLIRRAVTGTGPLVVWGDGGDVRDILHVRDFARGCLLALHFKADCDPLNIAAGEGISTADLARLILRAAGRPDEQIHFDPERPVALRFRVLDTRKARECLGFTPEIDLPTGLAEVVDWFRRSCGVSSSR